MDRCFWWDKNKVPGDLSRTLEVLAEEYPISPDKTGAAMEIRFAPSELANKLRVEKSGGIARITYGTLAMAARGVGAVLAGLPEEAPLAENADFRTLGVMLDCSRDSVPTVATVKRVLRRLALLGYNMAMLYTEDTYELPDEPFFGYCRGAYTAEELMDIDVYAAKLGVEMVPCIQTLGHLEKILRWPAYKAIKDADDSLLVGEEKTYALIEKMIAHWRRVFRTGRIHVGMDEVHNLGRGKHLDRWGYERDFDIFNRHLKRVVDICEKYKYAPMIWDDMYFRMGSETRDYLDLEAKIPKEIVEGIPKNLQFVYWDYHSDQEDFYRRAIDLRRGMGREPIMATGIWSWSGHLCYEHEKTVRALTPAFRVRKEKKVEEMIVTVWGNMGDPQTPGILAGLAFAAESAFAAPPVADRVAKRYRAACGFDYDAISLTGKIEVTPPRKYEPKTVRYIAARLTLWDDPLLGVYWRKLETETPATWDFWENYYADLAAALSRADGVEIGWTVCDLLRKKIAFRRELLAAWKRRDKEALRKLAGGPLDHLLDAIERYATLYRQSWLEDFKPFGLESFQGRIFALAGRCREIRGRLSAYSRGDVDDIPELNVSLDRE